MAAADELRPEMLLQHAGFVRALARSLLNDAHAAEDVVQETWLAALRRPPADRTRLRAWLGTVARNLALRDRRGVARRSQRERRSARSESLPSTEQVATQLEIQREVVAAVMALSEPYRSTIVFRFFHGHTPTEIAAAAAVPLKTVESRITRALQKLRARLDHVHGDRRAWCVALAPLVWPRKAAGATAVTGGLVATKLKLAAGAAVLAAVVGVWAVRPPPRETDARAERAVATSDSFPPVDSTPAARAAIEPASTGAPDPDDPAQESAVHWAAGVISGRVVTSDGKPFPEGTGISLTGPIVHERDLPADGTFRFEDLLAGAYELTVDADGYAPEFASFRVSQEHALVLDRMLFLGRGATIRYRISLVDGTPAPNVPFELSSKRVNAISNTADGAGKLRHIPKGKYVVTFTYANREHRWAIRLERDRDIDIEVVPDAEVVGRVRDALGRPVAGASVSFGGTVIRASTTTDDDGRYRLVGLAPGEYGITVTGVGFAAWGGRPSLARVARTKQDISLEPGSLAGRVRGTTETRWIQLAGPIRLMTRVDKDSAFSFWGLPAGNYRLKPTGPGPFAQRVLEIALLDGEERDGIEIDITKATFGFLEIEVRRSDGTPAVRPQFSVTDGFVSTSMAGVSIAPGRFRLRLESGKRVVVVSGSNNEGARIELDIAEGRTVTRSVKFKRPGGATWFELKTR
ncbi:MAG: sigma-70 family RNA polymerase sigma factor [Planctomycetota bacterium]